MTTDRVNRSFLILGHRGSPRRFRENTLPSFTAALEAGADGFETDVRRLADKSIVLFHDETIRRRRTESLTLAQLRLRAGAVTTLREMLRHVSAAGAPPRIVLEVKSSGWESELLAELAPYAPSLVSSFQRTVLTTLRNLGATFPLGLVTADRAFRSVDGLADDGISWLFPRFSIVTAQLIEECLRHSLTVVPWTANSPMLWRRLSNAGCHGVITDIPDAAARWRAGAMPPAGRRSPVE